MAAANAADPKTERKTEAERPAVSARPSGLGMHWDSLRFTLRLGPGYKDRPSGAACGQFGPSGAVGPSRAG